jgi:dTDP-4-amino-4,6-dideoxygalactose transaminase
MNAKMSEVHAAMGMAVLPHVPAIIAARRSIFQAYDDGLLGLGPARPTIPEGTGYNYAYYPVFLPSAAAREKALMDLAARGINARRYFFPSLNTLPYVRHISMPVSEDLAARVLCLPLYAGLGQDDIERVLLVLRSSLS